VKQFEVKIVDSPLQVEEIYSSVNDSTHGAVILFLGVVRNHNLGKKVLAVSYDVFAPLARVKFVEICEEANFKWGPDLKVALAHRVGRLEVGEVSVAIAVGSQHRDEAYKASRYIIDHLKHRAPIWKKEHYEDGETEWLEGHALCGHSEAEERPEEMQ